MLEEIGRLEGHEVIRKVKDKNSGGRVMGFAPPRVQELTTRAPADARGT